MIFSVAASLQLSPHTPGVVGMVGLGRGVVVEVVVVVVVWVVVVFCVVVVVVGGEGQPANSVVVLSIQIITIKILKFP